MDEGGSKKLLEEELFEFLKNLNVPVRMNDLKSPTTEFIIRVFECFLKDMQIDINNSALSWQAVQQIENAEICEESQMLLLLAICVNQVISPCGLNITVRDIIDPKPKRTKKILNYIIIFWFHYLKMWECFKRVEESLQQEQKVAEEMRVEIEILDEKFNECVNMLENLPSVEELSSCVASKLEKLAACEKENEAATKEYQDLKKKEADVQAHINAVDISIVSTKEKINDYQQLLLSSPEKFINENQKLKDRIKALNVKIKAKENEHREKEKSLHSLKSSQEDNEKDLALLQELSHQLQLLSETVNHLVYTTNECEQEEERVKKLEKDVEQLKEMKCAYEQKSTNIQLKSKKRKEEMLEILESQKREKLKKQKNLEYTKNAAKELSCKIEERVTAIENAYKIYKEAEAESKQDEADFMTWVENLKRNFEGDCEEVAIALKSLFSD